jgi:hypothetical protein
VSAIAPEHFPEQAEYCRRSRRLRALFGHQPVRLYQQLKQLGLETDAQPRFDANEPAPTGPAAAFATAVASQLTGPVLPYSQRLALLHEADQHGIPRFEANLIIAAVQHRAEYPALPTASTSRRLPSLVAVLLFLLVQSTILLTAWWITFR